MRIVRFLVLKGRSAAGDRATRAGSSFDGSRVARARLALRATAALATLALWSSAAGADTTLVGGSKIRINDRKGAANDTVSVAFKKDPALAAAKDAPVCLNASYVRIATDGSDSGWTGLSCLNWKKAGNGFRYSDKSGSVLGIKRISLRAGSLGFTIKGPSASPFHGPVKWVEASIRLGQTSYCGRFDKAFKKNTAPLVDVRGPSVACVEKQFAPELVVSRPQDGAINQEALGQNVVVMGVVEDIPKGRLFGGEVSVTVGGDFIFQRVPASVDQFTGAFTATVPVDGNADWFQPIVVEATNLRNGWATRERRIVMHGTATPDGSSSATADAFLHATGGDDEFFPTLTSRLEPDIRTAIEQQFPNLDAKAKELNPLIEHYCAACSAQQDSVDGRCPNGTYCVATLTSASITQVLQDPLTNIVVPDGPTNGTIDRLQVPRLRFNVHLRWDDIYALDIFGPFQADCDMTIDASDLNIDQFVRQTASFDGVQGDLFLYNRPSTASFTRAWDYRFTNVVGHSGLSDGSAKSVCPNPQDDFDKYKKMLAIVQAHTADVLALAEDAVDATFPNPLAKGLQSTLNAIKIVDPIANALGVDVATAYDPADIDKKTNPFGYTYGLDTEIGPRNPFVGAVQPVASFEPHANVSLPSFGERSVPVDKGGGPIDTAYDLALGIKEGPINQLLKAMVQQGSFQTTLQGDVAINGNKVPLTVGLLAAFCGQGFCPDLLATFDPKTPIEIRIRPTVAPVLYFRSSLLGGYSLDMRGVSIEAVTAPNDGSLPATIATLTLDVPLGFEIQLAAGPKGPATRLHPAIHLPSKLFLSLSVLENPFHLDESKVASVLPGIIADNLGSLVGAVQDFDLPQFQGRQLAGVTMTPAQNTGWLVVYLALQ